MAEIWDEAVAQEVREVQDAGYSEPVIRCLARAIDLNERYGPDAEEAFWERVAASYAAGAAS